MQHAFVLAMKCCCIYLTHYTFALQEIIGS